MPTVPLARVLVRKGYEVYGFARPSSRLNGLGDLRLPVYRGDLSDARAIDRAVRGMDLVFHIAPSYREPGLPAKAYYDANVEALGHVFIIAGEKAQPLNEVVQSIAWGLGVSEPKIRLPFWTLWTASVLCEGLCKPFGITPPLFRRRANFFRKARAFDATKVETVLGITPKVRLAEGLRRTVAWHRAQNML